MNGRRGNNIPRGAIELREVSKCFRKRTLRKQTYTTLKSNFLQRIMKRRQSSQNFVQALSALSLSVEPGRSLGVIGRNGSGKSTLLKLVSGIYQPDQGEVLTSGRISALIELGAGFHPDFTGRENVFLGGVMFGLNRQEIEAKLPSIIAYAELEDFIDDPVKTYSSGMYMRLGFSLAIHTDPDILLIDEVLAVGDAAFIHRCQETISEFRRRGKTLLFVTHDLDAVARWCDEAIWLDHGVIQERGEPRKVIDSYLQRVETGERERLNAEQPKDSESSVVAAANKTSAAVIQEQNTIVEPTADTQAELTRWGNRDVELSAVRMLRANGESTWLFHAEEAITIEVDFKIHRLVKDLVFGIGILRADGLTVFGTNTDIDGFEVAAAAQGQELPLLGKQSGTYRCQIKRLGLLENTYFLDVAAHRSDGFTYDYLHRLYKFSVRGSHKYHGVFNPEHRWECHFAENSGA